MSSTDPLQLTRRVAEAQTKDVGRGIARLDPVDLAQLDANIGDILIIQGAKQTAVKAMPSYISDRGKATIQIDGIVRENVGAGLDATITVQKSVHQVARSVALAPLSSATSSLHSRQHTQYVARLLQGQPVMVGDRVRVDLVGTGRSDYRVINVTPKGVGMVDLGTRLTIEGKTEQPNAPVGISYEDIGGQHREIQRIREMIELPLKYPEVFERLGIDAPKGVLLYGPPGTGKTLIARAVANETNAHFISVAGPEIIHKFYGESEAHLREIFQDAERRAPSIIFLDEIDAIAPKREETGGDRQVEKRVVAQLLSLMDGLKSRGKVIVIGATNIPNTLDPALRRPGRFDREIEIGIPDQNGRQEILEIHSRGMPLNLNVDLARIAAVTHGFVGADLEALCREAAMTALRGVIDKIDFANAELPYELLLTLEVTMNHFLSALGEISPSAIREIFIEVPNVSWEDVGGLSDIKNLLKEAIEWPIQHADLFAQAGATPPRGILLHGAPGTGKTLLAKAVAKESNANFISVKGPELLNRWVGESERGVREVFRKARQAQPCIVFFDEIDSLAPTRGAPRGSDVTERVLSQLLTEMDGIEPLKGVTVLAATNRIDMLDPALLRPGRFDQIFAVPKPDESARREIFVVHTRGKPLATDVDLEWLVEQAKGMTGADIANYCRNAAMNSIRRALTESTPDRPAVVLTIADFEDALHRFQA